MNIKIEEIIEILKSESISKIGLLTGIGGQILLCSELFLHQKISQEWMSHLHTVLEKRLENEEFIFSHCNGLAGIGWLYEYLSQRKVTDYDTNILLEDFDNYLEKALKNFLLEKNYDFLHGGVGVALYFAKRTTKKKELVNVLNQFLDDLEKISIQQDNGTFKWKSWLEREHGQVYNISLSHGMASIVGILSKLYKIEGINKEKVNHLLHGTVPYILAQEIDREKYGSYFPSISLENTTEIRKSRMGWCYGDLGIASVLYQAGNAVSEESWINKALEILLFAAEKRRDLEDNSVRDAGLCHGTAGIGHIFYRMWLNTRLPQFRDAADFWFQETLKMAQFEDGLAGYKAFEHPLWVNKYDLITGISGIGLAILTYYYEMNPEWDECLLLS